MKKFIFSLYLKNIIGKKTNHVLLTILGRRRTIHYHLYVRTLPFLQTLFSERLLGIKYIGEDIIIEHKSLINKRFFTKSINDKLYVSVHIAGYNLLF